MGHLKDASVGLLGYALALPANIKLSWKGLPGTNTLAYYENPQITTVKSFIVQAPGVACRANSNIVSVKYYKKAPGLAREYRT